MQCLHEHRKTICLQASVQQNGATNDTAHANTMQLKHEPHKTQLMSSIADRKRKQPSKPYIYIQCIIHQRA